MALINEQATLEENVRVSFKLYVMRLYAPQIARSVQPGQFVHMRIPSMQAHILRRPFSVYSRNIAEDTIDILYQNVGYGSEYMTTLDPGTQVDLIGAVGRTWQPPKHTEHALVVGGGVGAAPLYLLCEELNDARVTIDVILGAQTKDELVCCRRFEGLIGHETQCSTDDGSFGRSGFCTSLVIDAIDEAQSTGMTYDYVAACGPEPMLSLIAEVTRAAHIPCEVSMERRMACGIGACLSCVVNTTDGKKRVCVDGPIFNAEEIVW